MIFRRIKAHIEKENWFAVGIDFFIVVVGVFIGIQVANWNDARADREEFQLAVDRMLDEAKTNISALENIEAEAAARIAEVRGALTALQTCDDTPETLAAVNKGLPILSGAFGINLQTAALNQITEEPVLASQLSQAEKSILDELKFTLSVVQREADFAEELPIRERSANNPLIAVGGLEAVSSTYTGITFGGERRTVVIAAPVSVACKDNDLLKSFYHWERWQERIPIYTRLQREAIQNAIKDID